MQTYQSFNENTGEFEAGAKGDKEIGAASAKANSLPRQPSTRTVYSFPSKLV